MSRLTALLESRIESRHSVPGSQSEAKWILIVLAVVWVALFFRLGDLPLEQPDEGRNAEVAREMKESGVWLVPTYNGIDYLDKPAFYFKAVALALAAFGDSETAARIPSALFATALAALTYAFCRRLYSLRTAAMASIILATTPLFLINGRTIIFDIALALFTTAAIFAGYLAEEGDEKSRRRWYLLGAAAAGLATLVKGPVGFLVPTLVLLIYYPIAGKRAAWKRFFAPLNVVIFFAVTLPWFVGLCFAHRDFAYYGLVEESFHRFTTTAFHRSKPFYFYGIVVLGMFLPWSLLLVQSIVTTWKARRANLRADLLCAVWLVAVVVFFSLSKSKMPGYILSTTVAAAILVARLFDRALAEPAGRDARMTRYAAMALSVICLVAMSAVIFLSTHTELLARPLGIPVEAAAGFKSHTTIAIIMLAAFAVLGFAVFKLKPMARFATLALFPVLLVTVNFNLLNVVFSAKSARTLAHEIPALPPKTELACLQCFPAGLTFYRRHTATLITKDGGELTSNYILFNLKTNPWPSNMVPVADFDRWLASRDHPVYLVVRAQDRTRLEALAAPRAAAIQQLTPQYLGALLPPS